MVYSLFEYLIRKRMEQEEEPLNLLGGSRKSFRPTGESVLEILDTVDILRMTGNGYGTTQRTISHRWNVF